MAEAANRLQFFTSPESPGPVAPGSARAARSAGRTTWPARACGSGRASDASACRAGGPCRACRAGDTNTCRAGGPCWACRPDRSSRAGGPRVPHRRSPDRRIGRIDRAEPHRVERRLGRCILSKRPHDQEGRVGIGRPMNDLDAIAAVRGIPGHATDGKLIGRITQCLNAARCIGPEGTAAGHTDSKALNDHAVSRVTGVAARQVNLKRALELSAEVQVTLLIADRAGEAHGELLLHVVAGQVRCRRG